MSDRPLPDLTHFETTVPPAGPWRMEAMSDNMGPYWRLVHPRRDPIWLVTEAEAIAVRDALNRVAEQETK